MDPFQKFTPSFILYQSISEVHSVFYIIPIHFRSPLRLLYYTNPFQKSTPYFILYRSISEVHSIFYIIWFHFRSPLRLLYYIYPFQKSIPSFILTVPFQKSTPSFILYWSISEVHSVFYIIPIHFRSPFRLLDYTVPFQKFTPSFRLCRSNELRVSSSIIIIRVAVLCITYNYTAMIINYLRIIYLDKNL